MRESELNEKSFARVVQSFKLNVTTNCQKPSNEKPTINGYNSGPFPFSNNVIG